MVSIMAALDTRERLDLIFPCGSHDERHTDRHWASLRSHSRGTQGVRSVNDSQGRDVCTSHLERQVSENIRASDPSVFHI